MILHTSHLKHVKLLKVRKILSVFKIFSLQTPLFEHMMDNKGTGESGALFWATIKRFGLSTSDEEKTHSKAIPAKCFVAHVSFPCGVMLPILLLLLFCFFKIHLFLTLSSWRILNKSSNRRLKLLNNNRFSLYYFKAVVRDFFCFSNHERKK